MACKAPPFWCSAIFIVFGVIFAVLAVVPWFVVPDQVEKTVVDLSVVDSKSHSEFEDFADPPENPLIFSCYFWNLTNPDAVKTGGKPSLEAVGPYVYKRYQHRFNISFIEGGDEVLYQEYGDYYFYPNESFPNANPAVDPIYSVNVAYLSAVVAADATEQKIAFSAAQAQVFVSLKAGLTDVSQGFAISVLNSAWATMWGGFVAGVSGNTTLLKTFFDAPPVSSYTLPNPTITIIGTNGGYGLDEEQFALLCDPNTVNSWTNAASLDFWLPSLDSNVTNQKVGVLMAPPFSFTQLQAVAILKYRMINVYKNESLDGGILYGNVLNAATASKGITGFVPANPITWLAVLPNFGYRHFGRVQGSDTGILQIGPNSASIIDINAATSAKLFGNVPEISVWTKRNNGNAATIEFGANQPISSEMDIVRLPQNFGISDSKWILDTFSHEDGAVAIGVYLSLIPGVLAQFGGLYSVQRNFSVISFLWNSTIVSGTFGNFILANNDNDNPFDPLPPFNFPQAFQLYLYLKYNVIGSIIPAAFNALGGGVIYKTTAEEWLFGRVDPFITALQGNVPYQVGGIWDDYSKELGLKEPRDRYTTGKKDPRKARQQLTYEEETHLGRYYEAPFDPPVKGSSLTFIGPFRLQDKNGKKTTDESFLLWVPNVVRELELVYSTEVSLKGIDLYRYIANPKYESVAQSAEWINPYNFVMNCKKAYTNGFYDFYLTFPGWTLVQETELFNDLVDGVEQDEDNFILFWDFEPITGIAMAARAPLQLSIPIGFGPSWDKNNATTYRYNFLSTGFGSSHIPTWYIVRSNQISDEQADAWKKSVGAAKKLQLGLTIALPLFGFVLILIGVILIIWRAVGGKGDDMQEFELRT